MGKTYISPEEVQYQSTVLANDIVKFINASDFKPTRLISLARGGLAIAQYVHGVLNKSGIDTKFMTARTESYDNAGKQAKTVQVHGIEYIVKCSTSDDQFLIVDDIFDSGQSILALITKLKRKMGDQYPSNVCIATLYWKPHKNTTNLVPDFFIRTTEDWIVFPHEFDDLTIDEIEQFMGPKMASLFSKQKIDGVSASSSSASSSSEPQDSPAIVSSEASIVSSEDHPLPCQFLRLMASRRALEDFSPFGLKTFVFVGRIMFICRLRGPVKSLRSYVL